MSSYERIKLLKKEKKYDEAILVAKELISDTERESSQHHWGVAPAPYFELAKLYSLIKNPSAEIEVLERYFSQRFAEGRKKNTMAERYVKLCSKNQHEIPSDIKKKIKKILDDSMDKEIFLETLNQPDC